MLSIQRDVAYFHELTETPVCTVPAWPSDERVALRVDLVTEEVVRELLPAVESRDLVATADAIIDSIYVLVGMGLELGLPLQALWEEVQRSNISKAVLQPDGTFKVMRRADGKVLKPAGWTPPDIEGVLRAHGWKG